MEIVVVVVDMPITVRPSRERKIVVKYNDDCYLYCSLCFN